VGKLGKLKDARNTATHASRAGGSARAQATSRPGGRSAALLVAIALVLASGTASAGGGGGGGGNPIEGALIQTCGHWILKLEDFGKLKLSDYNSYVPENFQTVDGPIRPLLTFSFGVDTFAMIISYPNQQGVTTNRIATGTYAQNGRKLKLELDTVGVAALEATFSDLTENILFGNRELVTEVTFAQQRKPNKMKFKGRVRGDGMKIKFKAEMLYDIIFDNSSEYPDDIGAKARLKWRAKTEQCPAPPPP